MIMTKTEETTIARILADAYQVPPSEVTRLIGLIKQEGGSFGKPSIWRLKAGIGLRRDKRHDIEIVSTISAVDCLVETLRAYWD